MPSDLAVVRMTRGNAENIEWRRWTSGRTKQQIEQKRNAINLFPVSLALKMDYSREPGGSEATRRRIRDCITMAGEASLSSGESVPVTKSPGGELFATRPLSLCSQQLVNDTAIQGTARALGESLDRKVPFGEFHDHPSAVFVLILVHRSLIVLSVGTNPSISSLMDICEHKLGHVLIAFRFP